MRMMIMSIMIVFLTLMVEFMMVMKLTMMRMITKSKRLFIIMLTRKNSMRLISRLMAMMKLSLVKIMELIRSRLLMSTMSKV